MNRVYRDRLKRDEIMLSLSNTTRLRTRHVINDFRALPRATKIVKTLFAKNETSDCKGNTAFESNPSNLKKGIKLRAMNSLRLITVCANEMNQFMSHLNIR